MDALGLREPSAIAFISIMLETSPPGTQDMFPQSKIVARQPSEDERLLATESSRQLATVISQDLSSNSIELVRDGSGCTIAIPTVALNFLVDILTH